MWRSCLDSRLRSPPRRQGICHRNLDAENVAITIDGRATVVMDYGMAQLMPTGAGGEVALMRDQSVLSDIR